MNEELRELRLLYSLEGMGALIDWLDKMKLGDLPEPVAIFLVHASNVLNWHEVEL